MTKKRETLVVNLFGGPGAGKTTCAWEIAQKLKKLGFVTEYVGEYAKELVWDGRVDLLDGSIDKQSAVYAEQKHRVDRLIGKVDFVVTDSPAILSKVYLKEKDPSFEQRMVQDFRSYHNFCIFVERGAGYEKEGRLQTLEQAKGLDVEIKNMLAACEIYYGTYKHSSIDLSIRNMQQTFYKINGEGRPSLAKRIADAREKFPLSNTDKETPTREDYQR